MILLLSQMYDFVGDFETFYTGDTDPSISGLYDTFMGSKFLKQWEHEHCNNINGASDGTKFQSFIKPDDELLFFRKSMCRPQRLVSHVNHNILFTFDQNHCNYIRWNSSKILFRDFRNKNIVKHEKPNFLKI